VQPKFFRFAGRAWPTAIVAAIGHIGPDGKPTGQTRKHIVTTAPDGRVLITTPSLTAMCFMCCGGGRWDDELRDDREFLGRQIAEQAKNGVGKWAAQRFVEAMQHGGCSVDEAYEIMRDRFAAHLGTGHEIWPTEDLPTDRTYRDAWCRSANGGPIIIDERKAQEIDERRAWLAYETARGQTSVTRFSTLTGHSWRSQAAKASPAHDVQR
jgi:hypothetical protein